VIVTPQFHHWHHAKDKWAHDKNFAVHFPVIDMVFGTYHPLNSGFPKETGIEDEDFPKKGYIKQFLYPFK
jgi:lathosterol oxidase